MKLIGYYSSPYVRRVAITLKMYGLAFEHLPFSTSADRDAIKRYNPTGRIPALVLQTDEVLIDSSAIIDHLDELIGPQKALSPTAGAPRRKVVFMVSLALAAADKYVAAYYESMKRPQPRVWPEWLAHLECQIDAALSGLDERATEPFLCGDMLSQADVTTVAVVEAMRLDMTHLAPGGRYRNLDRIINSTFELPAFRETRPEP